MDALRSMELAGQHVMRTAPASFEVFVADSEPRLRIALTAAYGPVEGRAAAVDALSWAWEHWDQVRTMRNPVGYLFRVGQTAARRSRAKPFPVGEVVPTSDGVVSSLDTDLLAALSDLSEQQRLIVVLVHAFGWTVRETAETLELAPSTVQTHTKRGINRLRRALEHRDANRD